MEPVRLGVIGCGVIGSSHIEAAAASDLIDLVAVADLREDVAKTLATKHGVANVYKQGKELIKDAGVEAVILAMPACVRAELGVSAFRAGKHVLTEKPVAMNTGEVHALIAARGNLVGGCCSSRFRFPESAGVVTEFIASGVLGELRVIHCRALRPGTGPPDTAPPEWRLKKALNGGGIMSNWGCYDLDYLLGITGWTLRPRTVLGQTWTVPPKFNAMAAPNSDAETHLVAHVRCEGGTVIQFERGEMVAARLERAWKIVGTEGSLELQMRPDKEKSVVYNKASSDEGVVTEVIWKGEDEWGDTRDGLVDDFAAAVREGRSPRTSLENALVVQQITDAIYASAETGEAVGIG
jgi:UDP-N-acetyl-2-amino-2-deoxyglucuronate dehydrogenase